MIKKSGSAHWHGGIKDGGGTISTQTGALKDVPYGFKARFENGPAPTLFTIKAIHLDTTVKVTGADKAAVEKAIQDAKSGCPVSKLMKAEITLASTVET